VRLRMTILQFRTVLYCTYSLHTLYMYLQLVPLPFSIRDRTYSSSSTILNSWHVSFSWLRTVQIIYSTTTVVVYVHCIYVCRKKRCVLVYVHTVQRVLYGNSSYLQYVRTEYTYTVYIKCKWCRISARSKPSLRYQVL
jgi:hypothetical protein